MTQDDVTTVMWLGFVQWAGSEPDMRVASRDATGLVFFTPPESPIEAVIDEAVGIKETNAAAFVEWVTRKHWGLEYAPESYRKAVEGVA